MKLMKVVVAVALLFGATLTVHSQNAPSGLEPGKVPVDHIIMPQDPQGGVVFLLSDTGGWSGREQGVAEQLSALGSIVVGVDLGRYYEALATTEKDCIYTVADIERLTGQLYRSAKIDTYRLPVVAGIGAGGTLALAIAAQTPPSTIAATVAVDPGKVIPLKKQLCTPAPKAEVKGGIVYGLTPGALPNQIRILFSIQAPSEGYEQARNLQVVHGDIEVTDAPGSAEAILLFETKVILQQLAADHAPLDLPIIEGEVEPRYDSMAIIYSGDGGWRDIDRQLADFLQQDGVPVVGVDALRYFWHERQPEEVAADLSRIIYRYRERFGVRKVMLIGYSFGANILPATYKRLPKEDRDAISLISLLALSRQADFEIAVSGWLGFAGEGKHGDPVDDLQDIEPGKIQCVYGLEEDDTACPALQPLASQGAEIIARPGGHHFDRNYKILSDLIVARAEKAMAAK